MLLLIALGAAGAGIARAHLRNAQRHVVIELNNLEDDQEQVNVNCNQHRAFDTPRRKKAFDLGWLDPDDLITLSATNVRGRAATIGLRMTSNGEEIVSRRAGKAFTASGIQAAPGAIVFVTTATAGGRRLGTTGCFDKADAVPSAYSPLDLRASDSGGPLNSDGGLDAIDAIGERVWLAGALGWVVAAAILLFDPVIQRIPKPHWVREHQIQVVSAMCIAVAPLALTGVIGSELILDWLGTLLLFVSGGWLAFTLTPAHRAQRGVHRSR